MKRNWKKKSLAVLMTTAMVFQVMTPIAFADDETATDSGATTEQGSVNDGLMSPPPAQNNVPASQVDDDGEVVAPPADAPAPAPAPDADGEVVAPPEKPEPPVDEDGEVIAPPEKPAKGEALEDEVATVAGDEIVAVTMEAGDEFDAETGSYTFSSGEEASGTGYAWDGSTLTITDDGLTIDATSGDGLTLPADSEIVLDGNLTITTTGNDGISSGGNLTISGSGNLTITAGDDAISVNNCYDDLISTATGIITLNSAYGIYADTADIQAGTWKINTSDEGMYIYTELKISGATDMTIISDSNGYGIEVDGTMTISDSVSLDIQSGSSGIDVYDLISTSTGKIKIISDSGYGIYVSDNVSITDGTWDIASYYEGIYCGEKFDLYGSASLTIDSDIDEGIEAPTVSSTSTGTIKITTNYYGIYANTISIENGEWDITSGGSYAGIYCPSSGDKVTIGGSADVTITSTGGDGIECSSGELILKDSASLTIDSYDDAIYVDTLTSTTTGEIKITADHYGISAYDISITNGTWNIAGDYTSIDYCGEYDVEDDVPAVLTIANSNMTLTSTSRCGILGNYDTKIEIGAGSVVDIQAYGDGISCYGDLVLDNNGSLSVTESDDGICCANLTLSGSGDLNITAEDGFGIYVDAFTSTATGKITILESADGIYASPIAIEGGTWEITATYSGIYYDGDSATISIDETSSVEINAGEYGIGIYGSLTMEEVANLTINTSGLAGIYAYYDVEMALNGNVTIDTGDSGMPSGIQTSYGSATITGNGTITHSGNAYAIYAKTALTLGEESPAENAITIVTDNDICAGGTATLYDNVAFNGYLLSDGASVITVCGAITTDNGYYNGDSLQFATGATVTIAAYTAMGWDSFSSIDFSELEDGAIVNYGELHLSGEVIVDWDKITGDGFVYIDDVKYTTDGVEVPDGRLELDTDSVVVAGSDYADSFTWEDGTLTITSNLTIDSEKNGIILPAGSAIVINEGVTLTINADVYGIYMSYGDLTITNNGTLNINSLYDGVSMYGNLTITNNGTLNIVSSWYDGIYATGNLTLSGTGDWSFTASDDAFQVDGDFKSTLTGEIIINSYYFVFTVDSVDIAGGTWNISASSQGIDISGSVSITDVDWTMSGGGSEINGSSVILGGTFDLGSGYIYADNTLTLNEGTKIISVGSIYGGTVEDNGATIVSGLLYSVGTATVYGDYTLTSSISQGLSSGVAIDLETDAILTIPYGVTLDLSGDSTLDATNGSFVNEGILKLPSGTVLEEYVVETGVTGSGYFVIDDVYYLLDGSEATVVTDRLSFTKYEDQGTLAEDGYEWDADTLTLTLGDITYISAYPIGLPVEGNVTIALTGTANITISYDTFIKQAGTLTITGDGTMNICGSIDVDCKLVIESGTINISNPNGPGVILVGGFAMTGGELNVVGDGTAEGIYVYSTPGAEFSMTGGSLSIVNARNAIYMESETSVSVNIDESLTVTTDPTGGILWQSTEGSGNMQMAYYTEDGTIEGDPIGELTIKVESSSNSSNNSTSGGGGGGSSSSSSSDDEETEENEDGSVTETVENEDGTTTSTTTYEDGTVVETTEDADGNVTATVTTPDGEEATVLITTTEEPSDSTVVVIVYEDGTEEIIKDSTATEEGMLATVPDGATVKLVDNEKEFDDVSESDWYYKAVEFVTSREIFSGMGDGTFAPDTTMSRAMLMSVLYRLEGASFDAEGEEWYADAVGWAMMMGISDGTSPEVDITREQLIAILYRYAGEPDVDGDFSDFVDGDLVSGYAKDAMLWAIEEGLISGDGDGTLDSQGGATRAQVASILMRLVKK